MIIKRLKYLAVCLLVLLNVVSTMGGSHDDYKYYNSQLNSSLCLSFKNNRLTDCCKQDDMQRIYVHKTGPKTGIFYVKNYKKILCYKENKFKLLRPCNNRVKNQTGLKLPQCIRHHRCRREGRRRHRRLFDRHCRLNDTNEKILKKIGCELHENLAFGFSHISFREDSRYLGIRKGGRVQKHRSYGNNRVREPKSKGREFMAMSESSFHKITSKNNMCRA